MPSLRNQPGYRTVNGHRLDWGDASQGETVAAALARAGVPCRESVGGEPRGAFCGMGICFECRAELDGHPHARTCQIPLIPSVPSPLAEACELAVVGAGPAGLAAAARAAEAGLRVVLLDDNPDVGGQIWRGQPAHTGSEAARWAARVVSAGVTVARGVRVFDQPQAHTLAVETPAGARRLRYDRLILATGARERFLPFPGWTLPHVFGAGGLQAMVKGGLPIAGKRVVVAGSGPLLIAVAAYLRQHGAELAALCEQAPPAALAQFALAVLRDRGKVVQAWRLQRALGLRPVWPSSWPVATAPGAVTILRQGRERRIACDYLACGFHLVPNTELAQLLGCALQNGSVLVDDRQQTTVPGVYCAGEPTGIGGLELALVEGEIAGLAAAGQGAPAQALYAKRAASRAFAATLERAFALRPELRSLPTPATLVCRCEDVTYQRIAAHSDWRAAKLHTRCGMGACQGRVCGAALDYLRGWRLDAPRPPLFPAPLAGLACARHPPAP